MQKLLPVWAALVVACGHPEATSTGVTRPELPPRPSATASSEFWAVWGDGRAEMSGYRGVVSRYGELRQAETVLIYVTEPHDRRTWIKDDDVSDEHRVQVLKLNHNVRFLTGIYPYSVLTSVFAPVDAYATERFAPAKVSLTAQEWCGHVFTGIWPGRDRFVYSGLSYFASEGETTESVDVPRDTLYEDALLVQLRELDGPFNGGDDWQGNLVPMLWRTRQAHEPVRAAAARITRAHEERDGTEVTRFTIQQGDYQRVIDVERALPRRIVSWSASDGEEMRLLGTSRLAYWQLNHNGEERLRQELGLAPTLALPPERAAEPGAEVGESP